MNRYLLFSFDNAAPAKGGWGDFVKAFDSLPVAVKYAKVDQPETNFWEIIDVFSLEIVWNSVGERF